MASDIILVVRILITLTFLILAVGGPYAILKLNKFIKLHLLLHGEQSRRMDMIERRLTKLETREQ